MSDALISAIASGAAAIVVGIIQHNKSTAVLETKLENLTEQVKKHNSIIERTYELETKLAILEEKSK